MSQSPTKRGSISKPGGIPKKTRQAYGQAATQVSDFYDLGQVGVGTTVNTRTDTHDVNMTYAPDAPKALIKYLTPQLFTSKQATTTSRFGLSISRSNGPRFIAAWRTARVSRNETIFSNHLADLYADVGTAHPGVWQRWGPTTFGGKHLSDGAIAFTPVDVDVRMYHRLAHNAIVTYQNMLHDAAMAATSPEYPGPLVQSESVHRGFRVWIFYFHPIRTTSELQFIQFKANEDDASARASHLYTLAHMTKHTLEVREAVEPQLTATQLKPIAKHTSTPATHDQAGDDQGEAYLDLDLDQDLPDDRHGGGGGGGGSKEESSRSTNGARSQRGRGLVERRHQSKYEQGAESGSESEYEPGDDHDQISGQPGHHDLTYPFKIQSAHVQLDTETNPLSLAQITPVVGRTLPIVGEGATTDVLSLDWAALY